MVVRTNGFPAQGVWFSADVAFLTLTVTGGDFIDDIAGTNGVNNNLEQVIELLEQHGTVIGLSVTAASPTVAHFIVDYGQQLTTDGTTIGNQAGSTLVADLVIAIDLLAGFSGAAFTNIGTNFASAAA